MAPKIAQPSSCVYRLLYPAEANPSKMQHDTQYDPRIPQPRCVIPAHMRREKKTTWVERLTQ